MLLWRIAREPHVDTTLEGVGGLMVSGRWHRRGHPILYASSTAALAALEVLVHVDPLQAPDDWSRVPAPESTQAIGTDWLMRKSSVGLRVPSTVVPVESNVLLNPRHPEMNRVRILRNEPFRFDSRLL
jgi:RES domain-containing protein